MHVKTSFKKSSSESPVNAVCHTKSRHTYIWYHKDKNPHNSRLKKVVHWSRLSACSGGGGSRGPLAIAEIKMSSFLKSPIKNMVQPLTKHSWRGLSACSYRPQKAQAALQTSSLLAHMCLALLTRTPSHNVLRSHWSTCPWRVQAFNAVSLFCTWTSV